MSRFLKKRHYRLTLPGIQHFYTTLSDTNNESLEEIIMRYMNNTGVSYTQQDVAEIQSLFIQKYGLSPPLPPVFPSIDEQYRK